MLGLPMIRNAKTVDPRNLATTPVYQLETAMGSAISVFEGAEALRVPRSRFAPVKKTNDLLAVRSDAYVLTEASHVLLNPARPFGPPHIQLDERFYGFINDLDERLPWGAPSLIDCSSLKVVGDFRFGRNVKCVGDVLLSNSTRVQITIPDGATLTGELRY
jgi:UTP--glucose-1-phosphate uridylyltransferase